MVRVRSLKLFVDTTDGRAVFTDLGYRPTAFETSGADTIGNRAGDRSQSVALRVSARRGDGRSPRRGRSLYADLRLSAAALAAPAATSMPWSAV